MVSSHMTFMLLFMQSKMSKRVVFLGQHKPTTAFVIAKSIISAAAKNNTTICCQFVSNHLVNHDINTCHSPVLASDVNDYKNNEYQNSTNIYVIFVPVHSQVLGLWPLAHFL